MIRSIKGSGRFGHNVERRLTPEPDAIEGLQFRTLFSTVRIWCKAVRKMSLRLNAFSWGWGGTHQQLLRTRRGREAIHEQLLRTRRGRGAAHQLLLRTHRRRGATHQLLSPYRGSLIVVPIILWRGLHKHMGGGRLRYMVGHTRERKEMLIMTFTYRYACAQIKREKGHARIFYIFLPCRVLGLAVLET